MTGAHCTAPTEQICIKLNLGLRPKVGNRKLQIKVKCGLLFEQFLK